MTSNTSRDAAPIIRPDVVARPRTRRPANDTGATSAPLPNPLPTSPQPQQTASAVPAESAPSPVGYKKPPKHSQFKKGESGNKKGRPKGAKGLKTIVREVFAQKVVVRSATGSTRMSKMEAIVHKTAEKSFGGDMRAIITTLKLYAKYISDEASAPSGLNVANDVSAEEMDAADRAIVEAFLRKAREAEGER
ncbi:hypothetical protein F1C10_14630 [Sphingomonas sp. NBWT7]|uniref:DUF5681 domain-containing protein n=1 Tax=Sphingomonas sp. NBWT7 TaxID=2596913 RepID=UPI001629752B|nr:DUF5681 domain-containing protein [Sphingomonas sp. NBWT7]QNE33031.1 hypothetical protein F1C10_14630 [Sphingomonas sp. NBWT7]